MKHKERIKAALMRGETVTSLWGFKQKPAIIRVTNVCNLLISDGLPISKNMIYPEDGARYMAYWIPEVKIKELRRKFLQEMMKESEELGLYEK